MYDVDIIIQRLWNLDEPGKLPQVYTILDAARNENIYHMVRKIGGEYCCLFGKKIPLVLAKASPYLMKLEPDHPFTSLLIEKAWGHSWGIFMQSIVSMEELKQHFRKFIKAQDEDGNEFFSDTMIPASCRSICLHATEQRR